MDDDTEKKKSKGTKKCVKLRLTLKIIKITILITK